MMIKKSTELRPLIAVTMVGKKTTVEEFQHTVLRPILKMRNDELFRCFREYLRKKDKEFEQLSDMDKQKRIFDHLKNKVKLFDALNQYVLDELSPDEVLVYENHKRELNKRLKEMMGQRLGSNLSKLDRN